MTPEQAIDRVTEDHPLRCKMTIEEAMLNIRGMKRARIGAGIFVEEVTCLALAEDALCKQIAKPPKTEDGDHYCCPNCGQFFGKQRNYCHECGQRLKWSDNK